MSPRAIRWARASRFSSATVARSVASISAYRTRLFTWADGTLVHPDRYTAWFAKERERLRLPRIRLHDVRHTYASVGLRNATGWHEVKVISQRLGHSRSGSRSTLTRTCCPRRTSRRPTPAM